MPKRMIFSGRTAWTTILFAVSNSRRCAGSKWSNEVFMGAADVFIVGGF
jgi:hypothetical protein